jgi:hypothetical protein
MKRISQTTLAELIFLILVLIMGYIYIREPARKASWEQIQWKWRVLRQMLSLEGGVHWVPPLDPKSFPWPPLARFGDELELIGCDRLGGNLVT